MQPLVEKAVERGIVGRPIGLLAEIERRVGMDRAQHAGMQLLLVARLGGVGDHQIAFAVRQRVEDRGVVGMDVDAGGVQMGAVELFVAAAGIGEHRHLGLVDRRRASRTSPCRRSGRSASCPRADRGCVKKPSLARSSVTLIPPIADVELARLEIRGQRRPTRRRRIRRAPRAPGPAIAASVDVEAGIAAGRRIALREGGIVAGRADPQHAALQNVGKGGSVGAGDERRRSSAAPTNARITPPSGAAALR